MQVNDKAPTRQERMAAILKIPLDNLEGRTGPIEPSNNNVTKKSIMEVLNADQKSHVKYYLESGKHEGLTIQHLDPRQNRYNSVRYQMIKTSGHYLGERIDNWDCTQDGCDYFCTHQKLYFVSFGDTKPSICMDIVVLDDLKGIGQRASTKHLLSNHEEFVARKLQKMGVA